MNRRPQASPSSPPTTAHYVTHQKDSGLQDLRICIPHQHHAFHDDKRLQDGGRFFLSQKPAGNGGSVLRSSQPISAATPSPTRARDRRLCATSPWSSDRSSPAALRVPRSRRRCDADEFLAQALLRRASDKLYPNAHAGGSFERLEVRAGSHPLHDPLRQLLPRGLGHHQVSFARKRQHPPRPSAAAPPPASPSTASASPTSTPSDTTARLRAFPERGAQGDAGDIDMDFQDDRREEILNYVIGSVTARTRSPRLSPSAPSAPRPPSATWAAPSA